MLTAVEPLRPSITVLHTDTHACDKIYKDGVQVVIASNWYLHVYANVCVVVGLADFMYALHALLAC